MFPAPRLSVIVPAYNAARFLKDSVLQIEREVKKAGIPYEILIVEDGSTDNTAEIAAELAKKRNITYHHAKNRLGRGRALSKGFSLAKGKYVVYTDADLDIPPEYIFEIIHHLKAGYDIAVASKRHPKSIVGCPVQRRILSRGYNLLVRALLHSKIHGHQGGLKGFRKSVITALLPFVEDNKWFWDTEVLVLAQWKGYRIKEVPIAAKYGFEGTTVDIKDCAKMFTGIMRLRFRLRGIQRLLDKSS